MWDVLSPSIHRSVGRHEVMSKGIRIAILGISHYHANFWSKAIIASEKAELAGIWETDEILAADFASQYDTQPIQNLDTLLGSCNAVAICSTTAEHKPLIEAAANAGKPILCEKPIAMTVAEGMEIAALIKESGVVFMQSFPKRFDPVTKAIRDVVVSGDLGRINLCRVRHGHSHGLNPDFHHAWFVDPKKSGGGTLLDEGVHAADLLRYLFGEPERVQADISSSTLNLSVEDTALATFRYQDGLLAEIATSWCFAAADASIEIYGTNGTVLVSGVDIASRPTRENAFLQIFRRKGEDGDWEISEIVPHFKTGVFHEHVAWAYIDALANNEAMATGLTDGIHASAMIEAAYMAARSGKSQPINYPEISP